MGRPSPRDRARVLLADSFANLGSAYYNLAGLIRGGWENFWIKPCLDALTPLVLLMRDEDEGEGEGDET